MNKRILNRFLFLALVCLCVPCLAACTVGEAQAEGNVYQIYYISKEQTKAVTSEYVTAEENINSLVRELIGQLSTMPEKLEYIPTIQSGFPLLNYSIANNTLTLSFDEKYKELDPTVEILIRSALVRTFTQIKGIDYVIIRIKEEPLTDNLGTVVGAMSADMFIDNEGNEINAYEKVKLRLYFADSEGNSLVETSQNAVYSSNISMEKLVVEELIKGPRGSNAEIAFPTINPDTKIISVTVKDGTCYVNLDKAFLTPKNSVSAEVTVYSITNSLVELANVNKVQISINGEVNLMFCESISLSTIFERNLDLVSTVRE